MERFGAACLIENRFVAIHSSEFVVPDKSEKHHALQASVTSPVRVQVARDVLLCLQCPCGSRRSAAPKQTESSLSSCMSPASAPSLERAAVADGGAAPALSFARRGYADDAAALPWAPPPPATSPRVATSLRCALSRRLNAFLQLFRSPGAALQQPLACAASAGRRRDHLSRATSRACTTATAHRDAASWGTVQLLLRRRFAAQDAGTPFL